MSEEWKGIGKLIEECGELMQIAGKAIPFPVGEHPDFKGPVRERFIEECSDLYAALDYFCSVNMLSGQRMDDRRATKLEKFFHWGLTGIPVEASQFKRSRQFHV